MTNNEEYIFYSIYLLINELVNVEINELINN